MNTSNTPIPQNNVSTNSSDLSSESAINAFELHEKVAKLQEAILASNPTLPVLLRTIHTQLLKDPEQVTLLSEEEIGIIVNGLEKQTNTELATRTVKESKSTSASIKKAIKKGGGSIADLL